MSIKKLLSATVAVMIILCTVVSITAAEPSSAKLKVIDVSKWNTTIDWNTVSKSVDGVIARIGYRSSTTKRLFEDELFCSHLSGAKQYSIPVGVYFYSLATNETEAKEEAQWVIDKLESYNCKLEMPIYIDLEDSYLQTNLNTRQRTDVALAFCKIMKEKGYYAGVYANTYWLQTMLYDHELSSYPLWVAQYGESCTYTGKYGMWQYTETGKIDGVTGNVDISECYYDYPAFIKKYGYNSFTGSEDPSANDNDYSKSGMYKTLLATDVRSWASDKSSVVDKLPVGSEVYVNYAYDGWGAIPYGNSMGWIKLGLTTNKTDDHMSQKSGIGYYVINADTLNVREGPATTYTAVTQLHYADTVFIYGVQDNWGWFYGNGTKCWISLGYADFYPTISFETGVSGKTIEPITAKKGSNVKLPKWNITQSEKTFSGWATSEGGAAVYADEAEFTVGGTNMVLYAVNSVSGAYAFDKKPRSNENGKFIVGEERMSETDFMNKYFTLSKGTSYDLKLNKGSFVGTGSQLTLTAGGKVADRFTIIVSGDCNGDGICDSLDLADALSISRGSQSAASYTEFQKKAADVNLDGKVDSSDIKIIKDVASGTADMPS